MADSTRKLVAIMFTDIVGYTALMGEDEQGAMDLLKKNRDVQKPLIEKYNGTWLKELGDGTLSSFPSAIEAINCAIEIQRMVKWDHNHNLRIGIHVGDVIFEKGDVFGSGVNVASRIEPLSVTGGICISGTVYDAIRNHKDIETIDLGLKKLKNIDHEIRIYALKGEGLESPEAGEKPTKSFDPDVDEYLRQQKSKSKVSRRNYAIFGILSFTIIVLILFLRFNTKHSSTPDSGLIDSKSIAVLPFTTFSTDDESNSFFADGVHDDILTQLSKIKALKVISRTSVMRYKNTIKSIKEIAQELNVQHILEGSVRRAGNRIRIVSQLINVLTDEHIWSETYDRDYADIFAIQSDVAKKIAAALKATLTPEEVTYIDEKPTENMEAYDYFLKGKHFWNTKATLEGNQKAVDMFDRATELDPDFALAYARASITHSIIYRQISWDHTPKRKELAKSTLNKAIALDSDHPQVHFAKGVFLAFCLGDYNSALKEYENALKGEPNNAEIVQYLGRIYSRLGYWEKAEETFLKAYELDPLGINSAMAVGLLYQNIRQFNRAQHYYNLAIQTDPEQGHYYWYWAFNYLNGFGDINKARSLLDEGRMNIPNPKSMSSAQYWIERYAGDYSKALSYAKEGKKRSSNTLILGRAYYNLGEAKLAQKEFESMQVYYEEKIKREPENATFHSNLGLTYAYLGIKEKAITEGLRATDLRPVSKDHFNGPFRLTDMVEIYILTGEFGSALESIEYLLSIPSYLTKWTLRLDPIYDPLRDHPRFQKLVAGN